MTTREKPSPPAFDLVSRRKVTKIINLICFLGNQGTCCEIAIFQNCLEKNNRQECYYS